MTKWIIQYLLTSFPLERHKLYGGNNTSFMCIYDYSGGGGDTKTVWTGKTAKSEMAKPVMQFVLSSQPLPESSSSVVVHWHLTEKEVHHLLIMSVNRLEKHKWTPRSCIIRTINRKFNVSYYTHFWIFVLFTSWTKHFSTHSMKVEQVENKSALLSFLWSSLTDRLTWLLEKTDKFCITNHRLWLHAETRKEMRLVGLQQRAAEIKANWLNKSQRTLRRASTTRRSALFLGSALPCAVIGNKADICLAQAVLICQCAN